MMILAPHRTQVPVQKIRVKTAILRTSRSGFALTPLRYLNVVGRMTAKCSSNSCNDVQKRKTPHVA